MIKTISPVLVRRPCTIAVFCAVVAGQQSTCRARPSCRVEIHLLPHQNDIIDPQSSGDLLGSGRSHNLQRQETCARAGLERSADEPPIGSSQEFFREQKRFLVKASLIYKLGPMRGKKYRCLCVLLKGNVCLR